ncbi:MAG: PqqD family protein [Clostridia bacterium]|nr:PqqD family protein [Clostridia bacterium]
MKLKEGFIKSNLGGECVVVPVGAQTVDFRGLITLNETGEFLWDRLSEGKSEEEILPELISEYEVDEKTAREDIRSFIDDLEEKGFLE